MDDFSISQDAKKGRGTGWILLTIFVTALLLINFNKGQATKLEFTLGLSLYVLCFLPFILYFLKKDTTMPFLPILGALFFSQFGAPLFLNYHLLVNEGFAEPEIAKALSLSILGMISLYLSFFAFPKALAKTLPNLKMHLDLSIAYRLAMILGVFGLTVHYSIYTQFIPAPFRTFATFISQVPLVSVAILYTLQLQKKLNLFGKFMLWGCFLSLRVFLEMSTGFLFQIILYDMMTIFFVYIQQRRRIPWKSIIAAGIFMFLLYSAKYEFRSLTWPGGRESEKNPFQKGKLYIEIIYNKIIGKEIEYVYTYEQIASRANTLGMFVKIVRLTPAYIPYWNGYTYQNFFTSLVPRVFVPGKPSKELGQAFGHRYELLDPWDETTSANLPYLIEFYINFGVLGVAIGMFIMGLIFRFFYILLNHKNAGEGGMLLSLMVFVNLISVEINFVLMFGAIVQYAIIFYIILRLARRRKRIEQSV